MKLTVPWVLCMAMAIGGLCILAIIISLTVMTVSNVQIPAGTLALFGAITTAFLTGVFATAAHTIGFQNGTSNGEAQAQAQALRTMMGTEGHKDE